MARDYMSVSTDAMQMVVAVHDERSPDVARKQAAFWPAPESLVACHIRQLCELCCPIIMSFDLTTVVLEGTLRDLTA